MPLSFAQILRDFITDGVPSSGANKPKKSEMRAWGSWVESIISAFTSNGGLIYSSLVALNADLAHTAASMAWVMGDPTAANNGVYKKNGASGAGSWTRVGDLPYSFIVAADVGAGTANAIQATSSLPVSASALVVTNIFRVNTGSPVTISFNGGAPLTVKSNSGNDIVAGGLAAGMLMFGYVSGSTFRLISDQVSSAIVAAAEAAAAAAIAAAGLAQQRFVRARVVATSNVNIANGLEAGDTIDGVVLAGGDLVLLTGQTAPAQNGIYVAVASGTAARSPQFATFNDYPATMVTILEGAINASSRWQCLTPMGGVLGTTAISFAITSLNGQDGEGFFRGGTITRNATTPNTQLDVAPVSCRDRDNTITINRASAITKRLDAVFAVGSGNGGLDTGAKAADTFYFVFEIFNPSTLVSDVLLSASLNSPVMPSGFTKRRLNHAIRTDSSGNIIAFTNIGEWLYWNTDLVSVSSAVNGTTPTLRQLSVPSGAKLEVDTAIQAFSNGATGPGWISARDPDRGTFTATIATAIGFYQGLPVAAGNNLWWTSQVRIWTDNVGRIYTGDTNTTDGRVTIKTLGFRFDRVNTR